MLSGLIKYRTFIWQHAMADLRHRYAGTGMGIVWNVLHPLAVIVVYSLVFSTIFKAKLEGLGGKLPYTMYLCSGLFPWIALSESITRGCNSFIANAAYLKKLPIPEAVFVAQGVTASTLSLLVNFAMLLVVALILGYRPDWHWLLLPLPLIALQAIGFGSGLFLGTLNVFFRDIGELVTIGLNVLMWTAPIIYVADILPASVQAILPYHPLMPPLRSVRDLLFFHTMPPAWAWVGMIVWPIVVCTVAMLVLGKLRDEIRDVV